MNTIGRVFAFARWPIVIGMIIALATVVMQQHWSRPAQTPTSPPPEITGSPQHTAHYGPVSYADAVNAASAAVVNVYTRKQLKRRHPFFDNPLFRQFFDAPELQRETGFALGSGVIVSDEGYILTNNHVINGADDILVKLQDGRETPAELMGVNPETDIAVLKIEIAGLSPIEIGDPENARVGDVVLAIGNPFGLGQTVTQGIISATRRRGLHIAAYENFIQTDAAINPGSSGGALVDAYGRLLGINTANLAQSGYAGGIGFAIPADTAVRTFRDIVEYGRVVRGWLGVDAEQVTQEIANAFNLEATEGVLVTNIYPNGPAHKAGIQIGDVIVRINDQKLANTLQGGKQEIVQSRPGETVEIELIRRGQSKVVEATIEAEPIAG